MKNALSRLYELLVNCCSDIIDVDQLNVSVWLDQVSSNVESVSMTLPWLIKNTYIGLEHYLLSTRHTR